MAEKIKGKGVIAGIAVGNILLAGQNLDSFLVAYKPGKAAAENRAAEQGAVQKDLRPAADLPGRRLRGEL